MSGKSRKRQAKAQKRAVRVAAYAARDPRYASLSYTQFHHKHMRDRCDAAYAANRGEKR